MYQKGNIFAEQNRGGWIYGNFMPEGLAKDTRAEIKVIKLNKSFISKPHYNKISTKIDIIWQGNAIWEVEGKELEMHAGDYLIIPPKTVVRIKKILSDECIVQTIRIPSALDDKVLI